MSRARITEVETLAAGPIDRQVAGRFTVRTAGQGFVDVTGTVARFVQESGIAHGLAAIFCRHTSASLTIQENADPDVLTDLGSALDRLAPRNARYVHGLEGPDDMPAHIRTMLTDTSLTVRSRVGGSRSAAGRGSTSSSIATGRTSARSRLTSSARRNTVAGATRRICLSPG